MTAWTLTGSLTGHSLIWSTFSSAARQPFRTFGSMPTTRLMRAIPQAGSPFAVGLTSTTCRK
ncbi:hypothetical protein E2C01_061199 [Portunus trituberculatus]|uniref:Uncharacterized protein n=1 Tax=Portunus trituberculatus TaxID=210409 RepID=A0A5B7HB18_PORTR|nr:hypothetical protein [Portunus trituberculatus]